MIKKIKKGMYYHEVNFKNCFTNCLNLCDSNCASCHGADARGDRTQGAPNLTDEEWLYGGDVATLRRTIYGPRNGVMPAWTDRLDPATVRALAIYVHALGGGE